MNGEFFVIRKSWSQYVAITPCTCGSYQKAKIRARFWKRRYLIQTLGNDSFLLLTYCGMCSTILVCIWILTYVHCFKSVITVVRNMRWHGERLRSVGWNIINEMRIPNEQTVWCQISRLWDSFFCRSHLIHPVSFLFWFLVISSSGFSILLHLNGLLFYARYLLFASILCFPFHGDFQIMLLCAKVHCTEFVFGSSTVSSLYVFVMSLT